MPSAVKNIAKDYYHTNEGEPAGDEKYDYEKLYGIAKNLNADAAKKVEEKY